MNQQRGASTAAIFDRQELVARCMGNLEFACRILDKFRVRFLEDFWKLKEAWQVGDADSIASIAHRLKGASANLAAHGLRDRAATIEDLARRKDLAGIAFHLEQLEREWSSFDESVSALGDEAGCNPISMERSPCESW